MTKCVFFVRHCEPFLKNGVAIHKFSVTFAFWIATLALLARNDGKAKIQIFYSKFKAFYKFKSFDKFKAFHKFNSFYNFISNFKPYTRLFHIFTPNFCSVFTDKFTTKEFLWTDKAQKHPFKPVYDEHSRVLILGSFRHFALRKRADFTMRTAQTAFGKF